MGSRSEVIVGLDVGTTAVQKLSSACREAIAGNGIIVRCHGDLGELDGVEPQVIESFQGRVPPAA